jgi:hypothetical protein
MGNAPAYDKKAHAAFSSRWAISYHTHVKQDGWKEDEKVRGTKERFSRSGDVR